MSDSQSMRTLILNGILSALDSAGVNLTLSWEKDALVIRATLAAAAPGAEPGPPSASRAAPPIEVDHVASKVNRRASSPASKQPGNAKPKPVFRASAARVRRIMDLLGEPQHKTGLNLRAITLALGMAEGEKALLRPVLRELVEKQKLKFIIAGAKYRDAKAKVTRGRPKANPVVPKRKGATGEATPAQLAALEKARAARAKNVRNRRAHSVPSSTSGSKPNNQKTQAGSGKATAKKAAKTDKKAPAKKPPTKKQASKKAGTKRVPKKAAPNKPAAKRLAEADTASAVGDDGQVPQEESRKSPEFAS